jgi:membrane protein DedA with SNARE-associated domain
MATSFYFKATTNYRVALVADVLRYSPSGLNQRAGKVAILYHARKIKLQIGILLVYGVWQAAQHFGAIPNSVDLSSGLVSLTKGHGLLLLGAVAFIECIGGINVVFPGSVAVLLAMASTAGNVNRAITTFLVIFVASLLAQQFNYLIGNRFGGSQQAKTQPREGTLALWYVGSLWHPHFAAVSAMASGALEVPYVRFLAWYAPIYLLWNCFWGVLMYHSGFITTPGAHLEYVFVAYVLAWAGWVLLRTEGTR